MEEGSLFWSFSIFLINNKFPFSTESQNYWNIVLYFRELILLIIILFYFKIIKNFIYYVTEPCYNENSNLSEPILYRGFYTCILHYYGRNDRCLMPQKLETVLKHVEEISNDINRQLIYENQLISLTNNKKLFTI